MILQKLIKLLIKKHIILQKLIKLLIKTHYSIKMLNSLSKDEFIKN